MEERSKNILYFGYGSTAMAVFSVNFVALAAYQYDLNSEKIRVLPLIAYLVVLLSNLFASVVALLMPMRRLLLGSLFILSALSLVTGIVLNELTLWIFYLCSAIALGLMRVGFLNELVLQNDYERSTITDTCHLEAAYLAGVAVITVLSSIAITAPFLELKHMYWMISTIFLILGLLTQLRKNAFQFAYCNGTPASLGQILLSPLKTIGILRHSMIILLFSCVFLIGAIIGWMYAWTVDYTSKFLQLSDQLRWEFNLTQFICSIIGLMINAALVHYVRIRYLLIGGLLLNIIAVLFLTSAAFDYQPQQSIDTMAELPVFILLALLMIFVSSSISPILTGLAIFHTHNEKRNFLIGLATFGVLGGSMASNFIFHFVTDQFTPAILLGGTILPLCLVLILSVLFVGDLRKSSFIPTSTA
ncbi:MAG: hypothetical protein RMJ44_00480 [Cytophagales bacterium]|nr:hypothetical protein [Bernardetiaceae bacterium]MDW8209534.1 hypothetical protein [Cytophagales bacterium]